MRELVVNLIWERKDMKFCDFFAFFWNIHPLKKFFIWILFYIFVKILFFRTSSRRAFTKGHMPLHLTFMVRLTALTATLCCVSNRTERRIMFICLTILTSTITWSRFTVLITRNNGAGRRVATDVARCAVANVKGVFRRVFLRKTLFIT